MKIEYTKTRIILIPETAEEGKHIVDAVPEARAALVFYTMDAGKNGNEIGLVITHTQ